MNALVVLAIGDEPLWKYTLPPMRTACARHGWTFERIDSRKRCVTTYGDIANVAFEKFQAVDMLDEYDRILLLDADVMLSPTCPDVFDVVPEDAIGCVFEDVGPAEESRRRAIEWIRQLAFDPALEYWTEGYFNSGVMVFSKCHQDALRLDLNNTQVRDVASHGPWNDQHVLNYLARRSGCPIRRMGYRWNHMSMFADKHTHDSHIIHYAGLGGNQRFQAARADWEYWYATDGNLGVEL